MIAPPGPGPFPISLATVPFYVLLGTVAVFGLMWVALRIYHPQRKRGLEAFREAAGVSVGFLLLALALVVGLAAFDPSGNRTSYALFRTVISGYWLALAIPVVSVAGTVEMRSRGAIRWFLPSLAVAAGLFIAAFGYYYVYG